MTMRNILKKFPFLTQIIGAISALSLGGCTSTEMQQAGALMAGAGGVTALVGNNSDVRKAGAILAITGAAIALYGTYRANKEQQERAQYIGTRRAIPQYKSSNRSRYVAVSVPKDSTKEANLKKPSDAKNPKTVMVWDNENERLASSKAYVVDYKNGESATLGGKKTLFTGL